MKKNEKGFGLVEVLLIVVVIGLLGVIGWMFFDKQKNSKTATSTSEQSEKTKVSQTPKETQPKDTPAVKTSIYPNNSDGTISKEGYTVTLPDGWSVEKVFEPNDIVKTVGNDKYLISSFIEKNSDRNLMEQRVAEGIETVKTVKTTSGTNVSVLKTPTVLFLASCRPTGENCYLQLNGEQLYIHLYQVVPHAQAATNINYSSESAKVILGDFESIAQSLNL